MTNVLLIFIVFYTIAFHFDENMLSVKIIVKEFHCFFTVARLYIVIR